MLTGAHIQMDAHVMRAKAACVGVLLMIWEICYSRTATITGTVQQGKASRAHVESHKADAVEPYRPAVILEAGEQCSVDAVQVGLNHSGFQLAHQLCQAVTGCLPTSVIVAAGLGLIVLQHLSKAEPITQYMSTAYDTCSTVSTVVLYAPCM